ncbi:MAG: flavin reductase family protein [Phycisphaerales bacterium]|nr:flavin reductase family protein [Phycisphaerales bacterium]
MDADNVNPAILSHLPQGRFLLTAHHGDTRTGLLTPWVAPCSDTPVLLTVSVPRGALVEPLIRDSRMFTLSMPDSDDRVLSRRFAGELDRTDDPFVGLDMHQLPNGGLSPARCGHWVECQLAGHLAPESDHRIYLGLVIASSMPKGRSRRKRSA